MKYTQRFNLLQIGLKNKNFIAYNQIFFNELNKDLHKRLKMTDGKSYVIIWNDYFIKTLIETYPNTDLSNKLNSKTSEIEPLKRLKEICRILDISINENKKYNKILTYKPSSLNMGLKIKTNFLSTIISKFK